MENKEFTNMTLDEIGGWIDEREKQLANAQTNKQKVDEELLHISKQQLELQIRKKDLAISQTKADLVVKNLQLELRRGKAAFWACKNG
jgi:hypothetical protein